MKRLFSYVCLIILSASCMAAENDFKFNFYGHVRGILFYNSRASNENVDGLFYLYPKDHDYDPKGNDLNAYAQGSFYVLYTRLGVDIAGPKVGSAATKAKIEIDFRGSGTSFAVTRIRQAYVSLDWGKSDVLLGQTWHPLFGEVSPSMLNLSTGAPFQPFSRAPLIRYRYKPDAHITLTAAAIWQMQFNSAGPNGKSHNYLKNSCIPELFAGIDYRDNGWLVGAGVELLSLKPRLQSVVDGKTFKVNERVTSVSAEAHFKYKAPEWTLSGKTVLANNLTQASMLGGFAVTESDIVTGEKKYTPFRHSMSWLNFVYGKKWQPGVFLGYLKNLGTGKAVTGEQYGVGLDVDQLFSTNWQLSYVLPCWKLGVEFSTSTAWFGSLNKTNGRIVDTHSVTNYRVLGVVMFTF